MLQTHTCKTFTSPLTRHMFKRIFGRVWAYSARFRYIRKATSLPGFPPEVHGGDEGCQVHFSPRCCCRPGCRPPPRCRGIGSTPPPGQHCSIMPPLVGGKNCKFSRENLSKGGRPGRAITARAGSRFTAGGEPALPTALPVGELEGGGSQGSARRCRLGGGGWSRLPCHRHARLHGTVVHGRAVTMVAAGWARRQVEGNLVLVKGDGRLGEVVGRGSPAVRAGGVVDDHDGSLDLPTRTSRLAPTLAPPPSHIVALVCIGVWVAATSLVSASSFRLSPHGASTCVALLHTFPLLTSQVGLAVHRGVLVRLGATTLIPA